LTSLAKNNSSFKLKPMPTKTKIIATLGPATDNEKILQAMIEAGSSLFRLNFSHGTYQEHQTRIELIRKYEKRLGKNLAIIQDLSGPKIRLGKLFSEPMELKTGEVVKLFPGKKSPSQDLIPVNYPRLCQDLKKQDTLLLGDGDIELRVLETNGEKVFCKVIVGGKVGSKKGINLPSERLSLSVLTPKDRKDLKFGIQAGVDFIALSFVRKPEEIVRVKKLLHREKVEIPVIAKIETPQAVKNIEQIIRVSDAIMVARGDLGVELPLPEIPIIQKRIIRLANIYARPVITATQMLRSMVESKRPTRAEVTDVANAIFDGTDALMLSEETAIGRYPVETIKMMKKVALQAEKNWQSLALEVRQFPPAHSIPEAISASAVQMAGEMKAKAIITPTRSGYTTRLISRFRPGCPILAITPKKETLKQLALVWGASPVLAEDLEESPRLLEYASQLAKRHLKLKKGDLVVITAGLPIEKPGITNLVKLEKIS